MCVHALACAGCICCTLREDLLEEVAALAREGRFDYLIIESTGRWAIVFSCPLWLWSLGWYGLR